MHLQAGTEISACDPMLISATITPIKNALFRHRATSIVLVCASVEQYVRDVFVAVSEAVATHEVCRIRSSVLSVCLEDKFQSVMDSRKRSRAIKARTALLQGGLESTMCPPLINPFAGGKTIGEAEGLLIFEVFGIAHPSYIEWPLTTRKKFQSLAIKRNSIAHGNEDALHLGRSMPLADIVGLVECSYLTLIMMQLKFSEYLKHDRFLR